MSFEPSLSNREGIPSSPEAFLHFKIFQLYKNVGKNIFIPRNNSAQISFYSKFILHDLYIRNFDISV